MSAADGRADACGINLERGHARTAPDLGAGGDRPIRQRPIERRPIDDRRQRRWRRVVDRNPARRHESHGAQLIEGGAGRKIEPGESCRPRARRCNGPGRRPGHAPRRPASGRRAPARRAAMNRPPGPPPTMSTSTGSCIESLHYMRCVGVGAVVVRSSCRSSGQTRRFRFSHSPRPVIQNESRINFRSSQKLARFKYTRSSRNLLVRLMSRGA